VAIKKPFSLNCSVDEIARKIHCPLERHERILTRRSSYGFVPSNSDYLHRTAIKRKTMHLQPAGRPRRTVISLGCPSGSLSVKRRSAITSTNGIEFCIGTPQSQPDRKLKTISSSLAQCGRDRREVTQTRQGNLQKYRRVRPVRHRFPVVVLKHQVCAVLRMILGDVDPLRGKINSLIGCDCLR
jgi:hypothetical protein